MGIEFNVIAIFDCSNKHILMCRRRKNPYKGLYNLVGGKIEKGEDGLASAYRELEEETSISKNDIKLTHLIEATQHRRWIRVVRDIYYYRLYIHYLNYLQFVLKNQ
ncbi:NUDIX hydrolase [Alloiococcus sp. CFN-8]|uniref:NUDIX hydrolase n=1 Tax=Alloiococcus sp. CFN-8 TaxID=3416081 RepID=UPI003CF97C86